MELKDNVFYTPAEFAELRGCNVDTARTIFNVSDFPSENFGIEILIIIATIILTIISIDYATKIRGYEAFGGEYLIPILGLLIILIIEDIYQASEEKKKNCKKKGNKKNG